MLIRSAVLATLFLGLGVAQYVEALGKSGAALEAVSANPLYNPALQVQ